MQVRHRGLQVYGEAAVFHNTALFLLSVVGSREAVRGVLAGWAKGDTINVDGTYYFSPYFPKTFQVVRIGGNIFHGIGYMRTGYYFAQGEDSAKERLWASRWAEVPIPEEIWPRVRETIALTGYRAVGLVAPERHSVLRLLESLRAQGDT